LQACFEYSRDLFDPPIENNRTVIVISIRKNVVRFPDWVFEFSDCVNSQPFVIRGRRFDAGVAWTAPPASPLEPSPLKTVGTVTLVSGAGVAVLGGILLGVGANDAASLDIQGGAVARSQVDRAMTTNMLQGLGTGLLIAGGVGAAAGLVMRMVAPEAPVSKVSISAAPVTGGATVMIGGSL
jgi:hypothetical protein